MVAPAQRVTRAATLVAVPKLIGGAALIGLNVWVAHRLPLAAYGVFTIASTGLLLLDGVVGAALDAGVIRTAGEASSRFGAVWQPAERAGVALKIVAAAIAVVLATVAAAVVGRRDLIPFVVLVLTAGAGMLVLRSVLVHLQLRERFIAYGVTDLAHTALRWTAVVLVSAAGYASAAGVIGAYAIAPWTIAAVSATLLAVAPAARVAAEAEAEPEAADASRRLLSFALITLSTTAVGAVVARLDIFIIGAAAPSEQAGVFGAAATIALVPTWIGAYLAPAFTARIIPLCRVGGMQSFFATVQRRLIAAGIAGAAFGFVAAPLLVRALLPVSYAAAADVVPVLLVSGIAGFVTFPLVLHTLLFLSPRTYLFMDLVSLPFVVPLYIVAAQRSGALGVAWVTATAAVTKAVIAQVAARSAVRRAELAWAQGGHEAWASCV